jgi:hypothetical protein
VPIFGEKHVIGTATRGVGRFIAAHEECGAGFEIIRNGRGRLHLLCGECGEHTEYGSQDTEQLRAHGIDPEQAARARRFRPSRETMERWLPAPAALPWWVPNAYILGLILIGLALIALGVLRPGSDDRAILSGTDQEEMERSPVTTDQPAAAPAPVGPVTAGTGPAPRPKPTPAERPARAPELDRVEVLGRFAVAVPPEWEGGTGEGAVVFRDPGADAQLRVFLEPGGAKPGSLSDEASRFLTGEHPEAGITRPKPMRIGRFRAIEVVATYDGGVERAALLSAKGYSYLVLSRVEGDASAATRAASAAALRSFRPL